MLANSNVPLRGVCACPVHAANNCYLPPQGVKRLSGLTPNCFEHLLCYCVNNSTSAQTI